MAMNRYRKEIDGLRAIAVLAVMLFHAGFEPFRGGFVGVDVFFVLSGYLITSIIVKEKESGTFSITGFYERRARRILPALFFVILCILPFAWLWMLPSQIKDLAQTLVAVSLFTSNNLFSETGGYFSEASEYNPLLHTWSLAVEEQYYIVFPAFFVLLWSFGTRRFVVIVSTVVVLSFALAEWKWRTAAAESFYLTATRIWELLAGTLTAIYLKDRPPQKKGAEVLAALGIGLILYSVFSFDSTTPFPSVYTLVPTAGTVLTIAFATPDTVSGRILSTPVFVVIGLISYSAYLWHQPLFAFARIRSLNAPDETTFAALAIASLVLGYLSWRFVERPFRNRTKLSRTQIFTFAAVGSTAYIALGLVGYLSNGLEGRLSAKVLELHNYRYGINAQLARCDSKKGGYIKPEDACILGNPDKVDTALLGDSHALALAGEIGRAMEKRGQGVRLLTYSRCVPIRGLYRVDQGRSDPCPGYNEDVFEFLRTSPIKTLIIASRWMWYVEKEAFSNGEGGVEPGLSAYADVVGKPPSRNEEERMARVVQRYKDGLRDLLTLGKRIILIYPIPEVGWHVPDYLAKVAAFGETADAPLSTSYARYLERNRRAIAALDAVGEHPELVRIRPGNIFCDTFVKDRCVTEIEGVPLYFDDDHVSNVGARLVVDQIMRHMESR
ncbi:MAG: acyltransferase [Alphaproteobacteria bacterium]|nr:MAG: acyltransferase [Alphaproteobacteria bacterium]